MGSLTVVGVSGDVPTTVIPLAYHGGMDSVPHGTPSGFSYHKCRCEICVSAKRAKDRAYYEANKDRVKATVKKWDDANRDRRLATQKVYRGLNAEKIAEQKRASYRADPNPTKARAVVWAKANPEKRKEQRERFRAEHRDELRAKNLAYYYARMESDPEAIRANRRAAARTEKGALANRLASHKRRGARYDDEAREYAAILLNDPCVYCGGSGGEIDHIIPLAFGGLSGWENLTAACRSCNASKNDDGLLPFLLRKVA